MNLSVKIRKKYKAGLLKKWVWSNEIHYSSYLNCVLCKDFRGDGRGSSPMNCRGCPFSKFRKNDEVGCIMWINEVDNNFNMRDSNEKQFTHFINRAKKLIKFY